MVKHARHGDALWRVAHGDAGRWSDETHATITLAEAVDQLIWTLQAVHTPKDTPLPPLPKPRPRPGQDPPEEQLTGEPMTRDEWHDFWETGVHPNGRRESGDGVRPDHPDG